MIERRTGNPLISKENEKIKRKVIECINAKIVFRKECKKRKL